MKIKFWNTRPYAYGDIDIFPHVDEAWGRFKQERDRYLYGSSKEWLTLPSQITSIFKDLKAIKERLNTLEGKENIPYKEKDIVVGPIVDNFDTDSGRWVKEKWEKEDMHLYV